MPELVSMPIATQNPDSLRYATDDRVSDFYSVQGDASLGQFLREHPAIPHLLIEAVPELRRYFGDTEFALRLTSDDHGWETLYVDALWHGQAHEAIAALDRFEDAWWIENSHAASGSLTFTYRLV